MDKIEKLDKIEIGQSWKLGNIEQKYKSDKIEKSEKIENRTKLKRLARIKIGQNWKLDKILNQTKLK